MQDISMTFMTEKLISVIVPVYKVEAYLDRCVQSIVDQSYRNLEIILVDDGSPDKCPEMCDAWADKDPRIRVIHKSNGGGGEARNVGLEAADGDLIALIDSDDYIAPWMFAHLASYIEKGADISECEYEVVYDGNASFERTKLEDKEYSVDEAFRLHLRDQRFRQLLWNKLYKRDVIKHVRFPVGTSIDDEFFTYQVIGNAKRLVHTNQICYAYRQQQDSVMHSLKMSKRIQGLEAKMLRHQYVCEHFPELKDVSLRSIWFSCLYLGQFASRELSGEEKKHYIKLLEDKMKQFEKPKSKCVKDAIWIEAASVNFCFACYIRNYFRIGI